MKNINFKSTDMNVVEKLFASEMYWSVIMKLHEL